MVNSETTWARVGKGEWATLQTRLAKPYNKIFHWLFMSTPKIVYIVHPYAQFRSAGAPGSLGWMQPALVLWPVNAISEQQSPECCLFPHPANAAMGIRTTQLIESVFFSMGSHHHVNSVRYLIKEQMPLKNRETKHWASLLHGFSFDRNNLALPSLNKLASAWRS